MSRTYRNYISCKIAGGDNTLFYKHRRRKIKNLGRMQLRSLIAQYNPNDVSDMWEEPKFPMKDTWAEPSDGHYPMNKNMYNKWLKKHRLFGEPDNGYYSKDINYYIKPKNRKHYRVV